MNAAGLSVGLWALAVFVCAGLSGSADRALRRAAIAMAMVGLLAPLWFPAQWVLGRFVLTALGVLALGRTLDLVLRPTPLGFGVRLWLLIALFDVRRATRVVARIDVAEAKWLAIHAGVVGVAMFGVVALAPELDGIAGWLLRWGFGVCFCYAAVETVHSLLWLAYRLGGIAVPRINDAPIRSTTLAEFWGRRWNRVVAGWLRDYLFLPFARRRKSTLGVCAAFAGSTIIHFWIAWVPLDISMGLMMGSFFVVHGIALLLERRLAVERWPRSWQRGWTAAWLLLSSPLFVEPALRIYFAWM
ncbi:MAG TPA: MBOAT family protein [Enhygromyxa sp.]|nr:MBOAT family protein [Enhygromyxa sp.]